uniref:Endothelin converting enzyme 2a n=1 Tax=Xiphophorus couchianus TaxID=32473 RepID=A0A3B5KUE7_9TELE
FSCLITDNMEYLPDKNSSYKDVAYWDDRYRTEQQYDWLGNFSSFKHHLEKIIKKEDSILILGCLLPFRISSLSLCTPASKFPRSHPHSFLQPFTSQTPAACKTDIQDFSSHPHTISRCLKPGGCFVSITFAQPFFRKRLYARTAYNWSVRHDSYGEGFQYFVYVMTKGEQLSPEDAALEQRLLEEPKSQPASCPTPQDEEDNDFLCNINL